MWKPLIRWAMLLTVGSVAMSQTGTPPRSFRKQVQTVKKQSEPVRLLAVPDDAIKLAYEDVQEIPYHIRPYIRWIFIQDGNEDLRSMRTTSATWNYISRATGVIRPLPVKGGILLRVNLAFYFPREKDLDEVLKVWEELAFDPMFALLITKDTIDFSDKGKLHTVRKTIPQPDREEIRIIDHPGGDFKYPDDYGWTAKNVKPGKYETKLKFKVPDKVVESSQQADVLRFNSEAIDPVAFCKLQEEVHSQAPVVEHRYFKTRVLRTIKDAKVFKQVFGGLYYEFAGVRKAKDVLGKDTKATDLDLFFEDLGIGNIKGGVTADVLFDKLRSDQGIVTLHSKVTGDPREDLAFNTPAAREGSPWGNITGDVKSGNIDIGDRVFANLLTPRRDAREAIFPKANNFHRFALFNGAGALQDEVPPDIANDYMIPRPYHQRLEIIGCIWCHQMDGKDGWQPIRNEIKDLISKRFDINDDRGLLHRLNSDVIDRLAGRYTGDFRKNFTRAQDDLAEVMLRATGPWPESKDQTDVCKLTATRIHSEYGSYWWTPVDARIALRELGIVCGEEESLRLFQQIVPPDLRAFDRHKGIFPEDPRIAAISAGLSITRADWALSYSFAAERAFRNPVYRRLREVLKP